MIGIKKLYLIRHCEAIGQEQSAGLTSEGFKQALRLRDFLKMENIDYIVSSPYERAIKTIEPLAEINNLEINIDSRLVEKKLSQNPLLDWMDKLRRSFEDLTVCYEGGESSSQAMDRGVQVINELIKSSNDNIAVVTHGALLTLILRYFNDDIGFHQWKNLLNPDIYLLCVEGNENVKISRILI